MSAGTPVPLDGDLSREVLRTAREALTNIVAHAGARTARLGLLYEPEAVSLLVQDDGQGFDPRSGWQSDRFGLRAMADRASALGATVDLDSLPGWGTRIRARFPYTRDARAPAPVRPRVLVAAQQPALRAGLARLLAWTEPGPGDHRRGGHGRGGGRGLPDPAARGGPGRPEPGAGPETVPASPVPPSRRLPAGSPGC